MIDGVSTDLLSTDKSSENYHFIVTEGFDRLREIEEIVWHDGARSITIDDQAGKQSQILVSRAD